MITPKQRAFLKKEAHALEPSIMVGKSGVTETVIKQVEEMLEKRELIKGKCLDTSPEDAKEIVQILIDHTGSDFVQTIGRTFVLYRPAKKPVLVLPR